MKIEQWDKKSNINGIGAAEYLESMPFLKNKNVVLIKNEQGLVEQVQDLDSLVAYASIDTTNKSLQEIYKEYEDFLDLKNHTQVEPIEQLKIENETLLAAVSEMTEYIASQDARLTEQEERLATQENAITELSTIIAGGM